jgi:hypothetical protein
VVQVDGCAVSLPGRSALRRDGEKGVARAPRLPCPTHGAIRISKQFVCEADNRKADNRKADNRKADNGKADN